MYVKRKAEQTILADAPLQNEELASLTLSHWSNALEIEQDPLLWHGICRTSLLNKIGKELLCGTDTQEL